MPIRRAAHRHLCLLVLSTALSTCAACEADPKPLWEIGLGAGALALPDYRGSSTTHGYLLPVPYLIYRGQLFRSDREGVRGILYRQNFAEINVSGAVSVPVRNDAARQGMPNLRPTAEVGPSLDLHLFQTADRAVKLDLDLPLRAAFTIESSPKSVGWVFEPRFNVDFRGWGRAAGWNLGVQAGPQIADQQYNGYVYTVAPQYATPERPAYQAHGGYAGFGVVAAVSRRFRRVWFGAYIHRDWLANATFAPSPLVRQNSYLSGGLGFAWILAESSRRVESRD